MKQKKRPASQTEAMKLRWKKRIVFEKGYTEMCAEWMAERLEAFGSKTAVLLRTVDGKETRTCRVGSIDPAEYNAGAAQVS